MKIDSLDMTDSHRQEIVERVLACSAEHVLDHPWHGQHDRNREGPGSDVTAKTIVLTGALQPAAFAHNDAVFNIGGSVAAVQSLPSWGLYRDERLRLHAPEYC